VTLFSDADWAGEKSAVKRISGVFLALTGPNSFMPLAAISERQDSLAHSSTETEVVAADTAVKKCGLPSLTLWEKVIGKPLTIRFWEDNEACVATLKMGNNPNLRYVSRR
jgi:hypothetical protein